MLSRDRAPRGLRRGARLLRAALLATKCGFLPGARASLKVVRRRVAYSESEDGLGNDVALNFVGTAVNGHLAHVAIGGGESTGVSGARDGGEIAFIDGLPMERQRIRTDCLHHQFGQA